MPLQLDITDSPPTDANGSLTSDPPASRPFTASDLSIQYVYMIISSYMALATIIFIYLYAFYRYTPQHPSRDVVANPLELKNSTNEVIQTAVLRPRVKFLIVALCTVFMHFYCGLEIAMGTLLTSFAVKSTLQLDKGTGAAMTSLYWGTFTFFRLFAVFYIDYVGSELNLYFSLALVLLSNVFLLPIAFGATSAWYLWTGVALIGLGTSSIWASIFGFLEPYFPVTGKMAGSFTVSACVGEFVLPFVMGHFVDAYPSIFIWMTLFCSLACCCLFLTIAYLCKHKLTAWPTPLACRIKA